MFLDMPLLENLIIGLPSSEHRQNIDRVKFMLTMMQMPDLVDSIDDEEQDLDSTAPGEQDGISKRASLGDVMTNLRHSPRDEEEGQISESADVETFRHTGQSITPRFRPAGESRVDENSTNQGSARTKDPRKIGVHNTAWLMALSHSVRVKLHICRALIANPNVMIMQRPLHHFDEETANDVLKVLRKHIEARGLGYPEDSARERQPRTIFLIPETKTQAQAADVMWCVNSESKSVDVTVPPSGKRIGSKLVDVTLPPSGRRIGGSCLGLFK
jgi:hypothetical protein